MSFELIKIGDTLEFGLSHEALVDSEADVLVSPTDRDVKLGGNVVSKSISDKGGLAIENECKVWRQYLAQSSATFANQSGLKQGGLVVTQAGQLGVDRFIFHVHGPQDSESTSECSKNTEYCLYNILDTASSLGVKSISIPNLLPPGSKEAFACYAAMVETILIWCQHCNTGNLESIKVSTNGDEDLEQKLRIILIQTCFNVSQTPG